MSQLAKLFGVALFALFIGLLLGLSNSPVVGLILASLAASITAVMGLIKKNEPRISQSAYVLIGIFGLFGIAGVVAGLELRTGKVISNNLMQKKEKWYSIINDSSLVEKILIFEETGLLIDSSVKVDNREGSVATRSIVLFSASSTVVDKLNPENFNDIDNLYQAWKDEGPPWDSFADRIIRNFEVDNQLSQFKTVWILLKE